MSELDANPTVLKVRHHLVEFLGAPDEVFELSGSPVPGSPMTALNLAYFAPQGPQGPVVFATCGACLAPMADGRRVEGLVLLRKEPTPPVFDAIQRLLAQFALFPETSSAAVQLGDVVRAAEMLKPMCAMDAVLFMPPVPFVPGFHRAPIDKERFVDLIWLLPVYEAEAQYAMQHGPQALMMLFAAQGVDLTDLARSVADTSVDPAQAEAQAQQATQQAQERTKNQPPPPPKQTKPARRSAPQARPVQAEEAGPTVRIQRRGGGAARPNSGSQPASVPAQSQGSAPGRPRTARPSGRSRVAVRAPSRKEEIRFDLSAPAKPGQGTSAPKRAAAPPSPRAKRAAPPPVQTPEQLAAAKAKRVEALKQAAREAAERAALRHSGRSTKQPKSPKAPLVAAPADRSSVRAAAKRRRGIRPSIISEDTET